MSDVPNPLLTCGDADVIGSGAALNNNNMHVDMDVDVTGENTHSPRHSSSPQSPASALSSFLSMIEYATKPVLIDIAKRHNVQHPLRINLEMLRTLIVSHLSSGECAESEADACMQLVATFHIRSDVSYILTKYSFQIQILSSIISLVRSRPLQRILLCLALPCLANSRMHSPSMHPLGRLRPPPSAPSDLPPKRPVTCEFPATFQSAM